MKKIKLLIFVLSLLVLTGCVGAEQVALETATETPGAEVQPTDTAAALIKETVPQIEETPVVEDTPQSELEDTERCNRRDRKGYRQLPEGCEMVCTVDIDRFKYFTWQGSQEVPHQVDGIGQSESGMEQPNSKEGALQSNFGVKSCNRHDRQLQRNDLQSNQ